MALNPESVFRAANSVALLAWLALMAAPASPRWAPTIRRVAGRGLPLAFAAVYGALLFSAEPTGGNFNSLAGVQRLFSSPWVLTAGWVHYLAFDLFVGAWMAQRAAALRLPQWQVVPTLLLTFLFGPLGYAAFIGLCALCRPQVLRLSTGDPSENPQ